MSSLLSIAAVLLLSIQSATTLQLPSYSTLRANQSRAGILEIGLNNPDSTINVWNNEMLADLSDLVSRLNNDNTTQVVIFKSDVPNFFIAHLDLLIEPFDPTIAARSGVLFHNISTLPQLTIATINGIARGAGMEFVSALDIRYATKSRTVFAQPEVGLGLIPGAGGAQFLAKLIGRGRALEYVLSAQDFNAQDAEQIGYVNKAFDTVTEMETYAWEVAGRVARFPFGAAVLAKQAVDQAVGTSVDDVLDDADRFLQTLENPRFPTFVQRLLVLSENQTDTEAERYLGEVLPTIHY